MAKTVSTAAQIEARVREGLDLVDIIVAQTRRQLGHHHGVEEMQSAGREGLLQAARGFDPERGIPFRGFANLRIRGAVLDAFRSEGRLPRRMYQKVRAMQAADALGEVQAEAAPAAGTLTPAQADAAVGSSLATAAVAMAAAMLNLKGEEAYARVADTAPNVDEMLGQAQLRATMQRLIEAQPDPERTLLIQHYFHDETLEQAGKGMGLSKSWASRVHARGIEALARAMRRESIER